MTYAENRKAFHDYSIISKMEVGIELHGTEVKSVCQKNVSLAGAYVAVLKGELWLIGSSIQQYCNGSFFNHKMNRDRKLLCHKKELAELKHKTEAQGLTAVPLRLYAKGSKIKLEIGIAKGKKAADKRHSMRERDIKRDIERGER